jgi:hypothetical protein
VVVGHDNRQDPAALLTRSTRLEVDGGERLSPAPVRLKGFDKTKTTDGTSRNGTTCRPDVRGGGGTGDYLRESAS